MTKENDTPAVGGELQDIADEIEQSDGIALMLTGCSKQLGIRRTAMVVAALRAQPASPLRVTGAINQVEEAACLIWSELCPGLVMSDEDIPHYEAAAKAVLALPASPLRTQDDLRRLVDAVWLHATEGAHYPSTKTADMLISAASLSAAPPEQPAVQGREIELIRLALKQSYSDVMRDGVSVSVFNEQTAFETICAIFQSCVGQGVAPFIPGESIELAHRAQRERRAAEFASPVCNTSDDIEETK